MTHTPVYPAAAPPALTAADAASLWVANAQAGTALVIAIIVPHSWTDGVVVSGGTRYDILSRERATAWLPTAPPPLAAVLQIAIDHGPSFTDFPKFPTALTNLLAATPLRCRFHRGWPDRRNSYSHCPACGWPRDGIAGAVVWRPLPADAWATRPCPWPDTYTPDPDAPIWTPDEM